MFILQKNRNCIFKIIFKLMEAKKGFLKKSNFLLYILNLKAYCSNFKIFLIYFVNFLSLNIGFLYLKTLFFYINSINNIKFTC